MDFLKGLYARFAPWYDREQDEAKDKKAQQSEAEVLTFAVEANKVLQSYKRYGAVVSQSKGNKI